MIAVIKSISPSSPNLIHSQNSLITAPRVAIFLLFLDILGLTVSVLSTLYIRLGGLRLAFDSLFDSLFLGLMVLVLIGLYLGDTYRPDTQLTGLRAPARVIIMSAMVGIVVSTLLYFLGLWGKAILTGRGIWLPSLLTFTIWAVLTRIWMASLIKTHVGKRRWLVLVGEENAKKFGTELEKIDPMGQFVLLYEGHQPWLEEQTNSNIYIDTSQKSSEWLSQYWSGVIVGHGSHLSDSEIKRLVDIRLKGERIFSPQEFYETFAYKIPADLLHDSWFALTSGFHLFEGRLSWKIKRLLDILASSVALLVFSPVMAGVALAIKLDSPGPIFYTQTRSGLQGKPFRVIKFRSMYQNAEQKGARWATERDSRITRVGQWLRLMRVDELPQLWNVFRGDMSLIGPRPERPEFDEKLAETIPYYDVRYLVKPGITGWAQVMYPYGASVEDAYEKLSYDLYYIKNFSFWLDLAIALKTVRVVFLGKGR